MSAVPLVDLALRGGAGAPVARPARRTAIVVGAGGTLGSAVLEHALAAGAYATVRMLVDTPMAPAMRGLKPLTVAAMQAALAAGEPLDADTAFVVFDRARHAHGREAALHRPAPQELPALADALHRGGVRRLVVVLPHAPALLPEALRRGLASLDEHAVAALGFEHLVIVRPTQQAPAGGGLPRRWLQRVADGVLAQLHWMVPPRDQPLRPAKVAAFVVDLAAALPAAAPGTRIAAADLLWLHAQPGGGAPVVQAWLDGRTLPDLVAALPRM